MSQDALDQIDFDDLPPQAATLSDAEIEIEAPRTTELARVPIAEVLPADFELSALLKFVPNQALKAQADQATAYALSLDAKGAEGLQRADRALTVLREAQAAITENFREPTERAHAIHKTLTSKRSEWLKPGEDALKLVGRRVWEEERRLEAIETEKRRKAQEEADKAAREAAVREAEAAAKANAPAVVVEELKKQAETATAPPVTSTFAPSLSGTSTVTKWKGRIAGTPADAEPHPDMDQITPAQRLQVIEAMKGVIAGTVPITFFGFNWKNIDARTTADKTTFNVPGFEAWQDGGARSKGRRSK
jgi:hypothetical protein